MNINFIDAHMENFSLHNVGNKVADEGIILSKNPVIVDSEVHELISHYFLSKFKFQELYQFHHDIDLKYNEVYDFASKIFNDSNSLHEQSINLAKHLYKQSKHPQIKGGDLYIALFKNCIINNDIVEAIGIFKSENKDTFLKVYPVEENFKIESQQGININKLDKGCLIFNTEKENGYIVDIIDTTNKGLEAKYWTEDFLNVNLRKDSYNQTKNMLTLCSDFISKLPETEGKIDKISLLNKSKNALNKPSINIDDFIHDVFENPELIQNFKQHKDRFQEKRNFQFENNFNTSPQALKKKAFGNMTTIKLDGNFDINIHGGEKFIKRGYDEEIGMFYYQLFFNEEK